MPESNFMIVFYGISKIRKTCRESGSINAWSQSTDWLRGAQQGTSILEPVCKNVSIIGHIC